MKAKKTQQGNILLRCHVMRMPLCLAVFGYVFLTSPGNAQYPSGDRRALFDPPLAEWGDAMGFPTNPAALALRPSRSFGATAQVQSLAIQLNVSTLEWLLGLEGAKERLTSGLDFSDYFGHLAEGTSFEGPTLKSINSLESAAEKSYVDKMSSRVLPSLSAELAANPRRFDANTIQNNVEYRALRNTINADIKTVRSNVGDTLSEFVDDVLANSDFLSFYSNADLLSLSFISEGLGFRLLLSMHSFFRPHPGSFISDMGQVPLVEVSEVEQNNLPTGAEVVADPSTALAKVEAELMRVAQDTAARVAEGVHVDSLLQENIQHILSQGKLRFYHVGEASFQLGYGFELVPGVWQLGSWLNAQGFVGRDNYTLKTDRLDAADMLEAVNPLAGLLGFHAGLDLGSTIQLADGLMWSLVVTDVLGLAQTGKSANSTSFGGLYYPLDLDTGLMFFSPLGGDMRFGVGVEALDLLDVFLQRQRFDQQFNTIDHLRFLLSLNWLESFVLVLQYYNRSFGVGVRLAFQHFRPYFHLAVSPFTRGLEVGLNMISFSWW